MRELSTAVKKKISTLNDVAHERELGAALAELERDFAQWRNGKLDALELNQRVHAFHDGKSRERYKP